jgi:hypothetical protein
LSKLVQGNSKLLSHQEQQQKMMDKEVQHSKGPGPGATSTVAMLEIMGKKDFPTTK